MTMTSENLIYRNSDLYKTEVEGCRLTKAKNGKFYLWSEALEHNLAYNMATREDALLAAIDSLLFTIKLKDNRIAELQRVYDMASALADMIKPDPEDD